MEGVEAGTEATPKFRENERINMFLSFRLSDAETRYVNSERECLAIVKCLNEVKWLVIGSKFPTIIYSDNHALSDKFNKGDSTKARINTWLDRLSEFDLKVAHRSSRDQHVGLADGLSRMPTRYLSPPIEEIPERAPVRTKIPIEVESKPLCILDTRIDERYKKYQDSPMYPGLIEYLQNGISALEGMNRNQRRQLVRKARRYTLSPATDIPMLRYEEHNGAQSICLVEEEIPRFLSAAHEDHGHYAAQLCLSFLVGRAYCPTRVKDVYAWCGSCHACQLKAHKPIKTRMQTIQTFEPMAMVGLDWVGPITPACTVTGAVYILLMVDYFSRFLWAKAYTKHTAQEVVDLHENHVSPILGHPRAVYTDNGSHFVNELMKNYYRDRGITHYTGPISHPSSTGLLERAVQGLVSFLRTRCIECGTTDAWSLHVREGVLFSNTKDTRIHGYAPAEIILGFIPQMIHFDVSAAPIPDRFEAEIEEAPHHQQQDFMALRDGKKCLASEAAAYTHYIKGIRERRQ